MPNYGNIVNILHKKHKFSMNVVKKIYDKVLYLYQQYNNIYNETLPYHNNYKSNNDYKIKHLKIIEECKIKSNSYSQNTFASLVSVR